MKAMKKLFMLLGLALGMLTVGCTAGLDEEVALNNKVEIGVVLDEAARLEMIGQTATAVQVGWSEGDVIYVNGVKSEPIAAAYVGKSEGKFVVSGVTAPYEVVYAPALAYGNGDVIIPDNQRYNEKSLGGSCGVFAGKSETAAVSLEAAVGCVFVTVNGIPSGLCDLTIKAAAGELLAGAASVDFTTGALAVKGGLSSLTIKDVIVKDGKAQVLVPVPAQTYAEGFKVVITAANTEMTKSIGATAGTTIKLGTAMVMPEITYAGTPKAASIKSADDLQAFLIAVDAGDYSAYVNGAGEVVLENDIDLAGFALQGSIATGDAAFKHIFNGQGYVLKNWTVTSALFADNRGTIKNIIVDSSCVWAPATAGDHALIALKNNGIISGIQTSVDINVSAIEIGSAFTCGPVAARSYKQVFDCENFGDFTITGMNWTSGSVTFGGVVGYGWYKAGEYLVANCYNHGNITLATADGVPGKNYYVGGVIGATSQHGWAELTAENDYGIIFNCKNDGNVSCERKALLNGTYGNIGGIIGYAEADIVACENKGKVSYICVDDTTGDYAITRSAAGGVVGCGCFAITDCVNYGEVSMTGTHASGGGDTTAGCGASGNPCLGGIAGQAGNKLGLGDIVSGCVNNGMINLNVSMRPSNKTAFQLGGVIGLTNVDVKDCHNYGTIDMKSGMYTTYLGGAIGRLYQQGTVVENVTNNRSIELTASKSQCYVGGIVGHAYKANPIRNVAHQANIVVNEGHQTNGNSYIGTVVGQSGSGATVSDAVCVGSIRILSESQWRFGGIGGCIAGTIENCSFKGTLSAEKNASGAMGGINGFGQASISDCNANVTIFANETTPCGGLVGVHGNTEQNWNGNTVHFDIRAEGALCGILCGSNTASSKISTVGDVAPNKVKAGSMINGVVVTAADCADILKVYGGITSMSQAVLIDGGVVFVE